MVSCLRRVSHMTRGQKARRPSFYAARSVNLGRNDSRPLSPHPTFGTTALLLLLHLHFHSSTLFFFFTCCTSAPIADFVLFTTRPAWLVSNVRHRMKGGHQKNPVRFWLKKKRKKEKLYKEEKEFHRLLLLAESARAAGHLYMGSSREYARLNNITT